MLRVEKSKVDFKSHLLSRTASIIILRDSMSFQGNLWGFKFQMYKRLIWCDKSLKERSMLTNSLRLVVGCILTLYLFTYLACRLLPPYRLTTM